MKADKGARSSISTGTQPLICRRPWECWPPLPNQEWIICYWFLHTRLCRLIYHSSISEYLSLPSTISIKAFLIDLGSDVCAPLSFPGGSKICPLIIYRVNKPVALINFHIIITCVCSIDLQTWLCQQLQINNIAETIASKTLTWPLKLTTLQVNNHFFAVKYCFSDKTGPWP